MNLVKCPVELTPSFSIKSLPEELFHTSISFIFSLTNTSSLLSPRHVRLSFSLAHEFFPQTAPIVGSRFSDWAHYNEFVESGGKSWVAMRRRLVLGMKGTQNRAAQSSQREGTPCSRTGMRQPPLDHAGASPLFWASLLFFSASSLGGLCCYLFLSSVHPPPTLVSHPCLSSTACPLSHSFWRSVSCCGPHRLVQGSHPHQRGLGC